MRVSFPESGRPVGQARSRFFVATVGVLALVLAAAFCYVGYTAADKVPTRGYYDLKAEFTDANNLANHYEVRMGGVRVGQILDPRVENGKAVVDVRLDEKFGPLRADSKAQVRLRSAVGVRFLEIVPGTRGRFLENGETLQSSQVRDSVALDAVLGTFDKPTRARTSQLLRELGNATDGRGVELNETLRDAPGLLAGLRGVSNAITDRPGRQMSGFIRNGNAMAGAFDEARHDIVAGFEPEQQALQIFTDAKPDVQRTLREAGPALASLRSTLPRVDQLVGEIGLLAKRGRPTVAAAPVALRATTKLLDKAEKPFEELEDTLDVAERAVDPVLDLLAKVDPVVPAVDTFATALLPPLDHLAPRACELSVLPSAWASFLAVGDTQNNFIRFQFLAARPEQLAGQQGKGSEELDKFYDGFVNRTVYGGPCHNGDSAVSGRQHPLMGRVLSAGGRNFNRTDNLPYETSPDAKAGPSTIIGGGK